MTGFLPSLRQDLHFALRQLRKSPSFTIVAVLVLALGVGLATAMFSVVEATVLNTLPFHDPSRVMFMETHAAASYTQPSSWPGYEDTRAQNSSFESLAGFTNFGGMNLDAGSQVLHLHNTQGSDNFFDVLGVKPLLGRTYVAGEDQDGRNRVAVLSYSVWQQHFGGDPAVLGRSVRVDGFPYTIIGVMPASFRFPVGVPDVVYTPMRRPADTMKSRNNHWLQVMGRLKPRVTREQAQADMNRVLANMGRAYPNSDKGRTARIVPFTMYVTGEDQRQVLWIMAAGVAFVLLIACVDVAMMLLSRAVSRQREMAVRTALGASRARIVKQVLLESVVLGLMGAALGLLLSLAITKGMAHFLTTSFERGADVQLNFAVLGAAILLALISSVLFGIAPARAMAWVDPNRALKSGANAGTSRGDYRLRSIFVVSQVALSLMLLVCTCLVLVHLWQLQHVDFGFTADHVITLEISASPGEYEGKDLDATLYRPLADKLQGIPGVKAVGYNWLVPLLNWGWNSSVEIVGKPPDPVEHERLAEVRMVSPGWYKSMGVRLLRGRNFDNAIDTPKSQPVAVVNQKFADTFFPGEDPIGQQIKDKPNITIVGVVSNFRQAADEPPLAEKDLPMSQVSAAESLNTLNTMVLFVRTDLPPDSVVPQIRQALHEVAPTVPFRTPETMDDALGDALVFNRMQGWLFSIFAGIALILALTGIYGVLSQEVNLQTRDIGVRVALGADRLRIVRLVLRRAAMLLSVGIVAGIIGSMASRKLLASMIPIQGAHDVITVALLAVGLAMVGLVASLIPAKRAASIEPMKALRSE